MNREIRFRAWDGKRMVYTDWKSWRNWYSDMRGGKVAYGRGGIIETTLSDPMQYTGLKDKNRKEIYESDIVKTVNNYHNGDRVGVVTWEVNGYFIVQEKDLYCPGIDSSDHSPNIEVIGNLYETPELITPTP